MPKIMYNGIEFDSEEERLFYLYLEKLKAEGFVKDYTYHVDKFVLSDPVLYTWFKQMKTKEKCMESTLLQGHIYTPDFRIHWNYDKAYEVFYHDIFDEVQHGVLPFINNINNRGEDVGSYVEIKPAFDMNNMTRLFTINQKWIFQEHRIYVQKIIPVKLFEKTFVPEEAKYTAKTRKLKKYKFETKSLHEYIGGFHE